jgi:hypothetical protein
VLPVLSPSPPPRPESGVRSRLREDDLLDWRERIIRDAAATQQKPFGQPFSTGALLLVLSIVIPPLWIAFILYMYHRNEKRKAAQRQLSDTLIDFAEKFPDHPAVTAMRRGPLDREAAWEVVQVLDEHPALSEITLLLRHPGAWIIPAHPYKVFVNGSYVGDGAMRDGLRLTVPALAGPIFLTIRWNSGSEWVLGVFDCPRPGRYEIEIAQQFGGASMISLR